MASQQVVVRVLDGESLVDESIRRPVRLTPDGFAGVVYAGAVYPMFAGNVVDIAGPSWEVEDCNRFLLAGAPVPYAQRVDGQSSNPPFGGLHGEWTVETNRFGHYVVFNASERVASLAVDSLEAAGVSVQRWDVSHRAAATASSTTGSRGCASRDRLTKPWRWSVPSSHHQPLTLHPQQRLRHHSLALKS